MPGFSSVPVYASQYTSKKKDPIKSGESTIIVLFLLLGTVLVVLAYFKPSNISNVEFSPKKIKIEMRYKPDKLEIANVLLVTSDGSLHKVAPETKDKLVADARTRSDEVRAPEDYLLLATEAWRAEEYGKAMELATTGLSLKPKNTRVHATLLHRIGSIYGSLEIYGLAGEYYRAAIMAEPAFSWPHTGLGIVYYNQKRYAESEVEYKKAIKIDPESMHAYYNLATFYFNQNRYVEAVAMYKMVTQINPEHVAAYNNLGNIYFHLERYAEAEVEYKKILEIDPEYGNAIDTLKALKYKK